jgi:hypothetical protein
MVSNADLFFRLRMLKLFLQHSAQLKQQLLQELFENATDPVMRQRRFRMLRQLSTYESQIIGKIQNLHTDNTKDFLNRSFEFETDLVVRRDA